MVTCLVRTEHSNTNPADHYEDVVAALNQAGSTGWELINIESTDTQFSGPYNSPSDWSMTRYTFKRGSPA